ncbi:MAG: hypothetical protein ACO3ND_02375 [Opitutales bacterium]
MGTSFTWGFPDDGGVSIQPAPVSQPQSADTIIRESLRQSVTGSFFPPLPAGAQAQRATGIGIQNIKRGFLNLQVPFDSSVVGIDFQTNSTSFVDVNQELGGTMETSGRPVALILRCRESGSLTGSQFVSFSVRIGNQEVTGSEGILRLAPATAGTGMWFTIPPAGSTPFAMVWKVSAGTALMPRSWRPSLTVVEI